MKFFNHEFILIDADEYAVEYMEKHKYEFFKANMEHILPKLQSVADEHYEELKSLFSQNDLDNSGQITFPAFW